MIGRYFCAASAVATALLMLPLLRTIARSFAIRSRVLDVPFREEASYRHTACSFHGQYNLENTWSRGEFHRFHALFDLHPAMDQAGDIDALFGQGANRFPKRTTAAADDIDLIDDQRCQVQRLACGNRAFKHD